MVISSKEATLQTKKKIWKVINLVEVEGIDDEESGGASWSDDEDDDKNVIRILIEKV